MYDRLLQRVKLRCRCRIAWLRNVWIEKNGKPVEDAFANYHSEVDSYLNDKDIPAAEKHWIQQQPYLQSWVNELEKLEEALKRDKQSRLAKLKEVFLLSEIECDIIQACLALVLDPSLSAVYAYLHDHKNRGYVSLSMVARLFGHDRYIAIGSGSPLKKWEIITETPMAAGEPPRIDIDNSIRCWLLGNNDLDEHLSPYTSAIVAQKPLAHWPIAGSAEEIKVQLHQKNGWPVRMLIIGPSGSGRSQFAAAVSEKLGKKLICIHSDAIPSSSWQVIYLRAQREAMLNSYSLLWKEQIASGKEWPLTIPATPLQWITGEMEESLPPRSDITDIRIEMPPIPFKQSNTLLFQYVPNAKKWNKTALHQLLNKHPLTIGQINTLAIKQPATIEAASDILRATARYRLGNLGQQLQSSLTWDDLVIAGWLRKQLDDFFYEASERNALWENAQTRRLFPQGRGLFALFSGPPGTGKTMAAQILANSLQMDLFRIDLSAIVSKYVGETSRNLERILSRARDMNVVLLFDEADSLFGKRTEIKDAHDRYANTDTNYLLQALEQYPGIAILSSNKKSNIDEGFFRRIRFVLEFQAPDANLRLMLWRRLVHDLSGKETAEKLDTALVQIATQLDLTGAQVKFAILSAMFLSRRERAPVNISHILLGLERELMKEGRGIGKQIHELLKK